MLDPGPKLAENTVYFDPNYTISRERASYKPQGEENEKHDSGMRTPPLWRTSPTASPPRRYRSLSPASKAQAIARGQRELMDMVRTMPEGCFELSLRDLVEKPWARPADHQHHHLHHHHHLIPKEETATMKRSDNSSSSCRISRNGSMDGSRGGFLLKMVFPVSVGSKKKKQSKKNNPPANSGHVKSRVSPKPSSDKDWWKRKIPALEESTTATTTTATTTTRSGHEISLLPSCCSFIRPRKIKVQQ